MTRWYDTGGVEQQGELHSTGGEEAGGPGPSSSLETPGLDHWHCSAHPGEQQWRGGGVWHSGSSCLHCHQSQDTCFSTWLARQQLQNRITEDKLCWSILYWGRWFHFTIVLICAFESCYWCIFNSIYIQFHLFNSWVTMKYINVVKPIEIVTEHEKMNILQVILVLLSWAGAEMIIWIARTSPEMMIPIPWTR